MRSPTRPGSGAPDPTRLAGLSVRDPARIIARRHVKVRLTRIIRLRPLTITACERFCISLIHRLVVADVDKRRPKDSRPDQSAITAHGSAKLRMPREGAGSAAPLLPVASDRNQPRGVRRRIACPSAIVGQWGIRLVPQVHEQALVLNILHHVAHLSADQPRPSQSA